MLESLTNILRRVGLRNTAEFCLSRIRGQLAGRPPLPVGGPWHLKLGRSKWEGLAVELTAPLVGARLADTLRMLGTGISVEMTFITHTKPVAQESVRGRFGVSPLVTPLGLPNEIRTYLLLRSTGDLSTNCDDLLRSACLYTGGQFRYLSGNEALALMQPWAVENIEARSPDRPASEQSVSYAAFIAGPQGVHARAPLQLASFDRNGDVESWEVTTVTTPSWDALHPRRGNNDPTVYESYVKGQQFVAHIRSAVLLAKRGNIEAGLRQRQERFHSAGFSTRVIPAGGGYAAVVAPWLSPLAERPASAFSVTSATDAARRLSIPRGLSSIGPFAAKTRGEGPWDTTATCLTAVNLRGASLTLGPTCSSEPSNTLIAGNAGSGLTYTANAMLAAHLGGGGLAWALREATAPVFDDVHPAKELVLSPETPCSLNPLAGFKSQADLYAAMSELKHWVYRLSGLAEAAYGELDMLRVIAIEIAIQRAWDLAGVELGLPGVIEALDAPATYPEELWRTRGRELAAALRQRVSTMAYEWFSGPSSVDASAPYVSFTLTGFPSNSHEGKMLAWTVLTLHGQIANRVPGCPRRMMLVDSVDLLGDSGAPELLRAVLRHARKRNIRHVLTTRPFDAAPGGQSPHQAVLWEECPLKALMTLDSPRSASWMEALGQEFTAQELASAGGRGFRAFAWFAERSRGMLPAALMLPAEAAILLAPSPQEAEMYKLAKDAGASSYQAIENAESLSRNERRSR